MYPSVRDVSGASLRAPGGEQVRTRVGGTVLALGTVSLLTDVSSEMVAAVLPVYLTLAVGLSPLVFGVLDGLYQGVSVFVRLGAAVVADRTRRPKATAATGYGLSAACKVGLMAATGPAAIGAVLAVDRTGKGLRTAPRDALIAASVPPAILGRAFGVHRAMDTVGALLGPLAAFALLFYLPGDYGSVFLASAVFAVLGLAVLLTFVREPVVVPSLPAVTGRALRRLAAGPGLRRVAVTSAFLGLLTVSDGFVYLVLIDRGAVSAAFVPLLFVATASVYLVLAVPFGRLADRIGRVPVLVGGYAALLLAYLALLAGDLEGFALAAAVLGALGVYYAATDGVLAALAAALTPEHVRSSGIALVQTAVVGGRLLAAVLFGWLWTVWTADAALMAFALALAVALPALPRLLRGVERATSSRRAAS